MRSVVCKAAVVLAWLSAGTVLAGVGFIVSVLVLRGGGALNGDFMFGDTPWIDALLGRRPVFGGIWPALVGTLALVLATACLALPVGVAAGIHLAQFSNPRGRRSIGLAVDLLAGVPSIVMGLFGYMLILLLRRTVVEDANRCLLLSAVCLAILVLPYLIRTTQNALEALPESITLIGPALGMTTMQNLRHVLLPAASRGMLSGIILAVGRIAEDTAVILLAGAVFNAGLPGGPLERFEALPYRIYWLTSQYRNDGELEQAFGCALVLLLLTATLFSIAFWLRRRLEQQWRS